MSTSSVGREEERKPLLDAYMFERRLLFGCTVLVGVALIFWIVAVSTDHWFIISGEGGIYIPRTNRYFMSSHSGLWRICRYSKNPVPRVNLTAALNITTLSFINSQVLQNAKLEISQLPYIQDFLNPNHSLPLDPHATLLQHPVFNETSKRQMFAYWVSGETVEFGKYKKAYHDARSPSPKVNGKVLEVNSTHIGLVHTLYQDLVVNLTTNGTNMYYVLPRGLKEVLFDGWTEKPRIPRLLLAYARDLEIPLIVPDETGTILQLVPPKPPRRGRMQNGLEYISVPACRYIDMFPTENTIRNDPTIDNAVLDYIRTQASFACIAVIVMAMGCFFSIYTFMNPRYMFKRLASGIHFISAALTLVVIQVLIASVDYKEENLSYSYPEGAEREYGYGTYIAWLVFACNLFAGIMFMWYSGKKKGNKAATDELAMADEAVNIGR